MTTLIKLLMDLTEGAVVLVLRISMLKVVRLRDGITIAVSGLTTHNPH